MRVFEILEEIIQAVEDAKGVPMSSSAIVNRPALLVTAFVCVYGSYHDPSLPLSWLLILPSVWGGLTLTVRGTAYLALTVALLAASMTYLPQNEKFGYDGLLPASTIMDLLVIASTAFTLLLALMREQRAAHVAERGHAPGKRAHAPHAHAPELIGERRFQTGEAAREQFDVFVFHGAGPIIR